MRLGNPKEIESDKGERLKNKKYILPHVLARLGSGVQDDHNLEEQGQV